MVRRAVPGEPYSLDDGLGIRWIQSDGRTHTEVLELTPTLAARPVVEQAIRGRASRYADLDIRSFAPVRRVERAGGSDNRFTDSASTRRFLADLEKNERDQPLTLAEDLALLRSSGLKNVSAFWLEYRELVSGGQK